MIEFLNGAEEDFLLTTYGQRPLHVAKAFNSPPLTLETIENALLRGVLQPPAIRMAKGGRPIPLERYTSTQEVGHMPTRFVADVGRIRALISAGASLVVDSMERWFTEAYELCRQTEVWTGEFVDANLYVTPHAATGFSPHWDAQEVFMIQLWGSKKWSVWSSERQAVITGGFPGEGLGEPILSVELNPGDILYVPRGFVHSGRATGDGSAHLSISVNSTTHTQSLSMLLSRLASLRPEVFGRTKLPTDEGGAVQRIELIECLDELKEYLQSDAEPRPGSDTSPPSLASLLSSEKST